MEEVFSVEYFTENIRKHIDLHIDFNDKVDAMNSYYRSIASTLVTKKLASSSETLNRIRNLDEAYTIVKTQEF